MARTRVIVALIIVAALAFVGGVDATASSNPNVKALVTLWDGQEQPVSCPHGNLHDGIPVNGSQGIFCFRPTSSSTSTTSPPPASSTTTSTRPTTTSSTTTSTTARSTTTTVPPGPTVASLMADSIFNQPVTSWAVASSSAADVSSLLSQIRANYNNFGVSAADPIAVVPAGTPLVPVSCNNCATDPQIPVPSYQPSPGSDLPIFLVDPSANKNWEFWLFKPSGSGYSASWGGQATLSSFDGVFPAPYGESATGISYAATAVTASDLQSGAINHAIAMTLVDCNGGIYPATRTDCGSSPGSPAEGQWFRLGSSVNCSNYATSTFALYVCRAAQRYGLVVTDKSGAIEISTQEGSAVTSYWAGQPEYQVINGLPWSQLQAIVPPAGASYDLRPVVYEHWHLAPYSKHQVGTAK